MEPLKFKFVKKFEETSEVKTFRFLPQKKFAFKPGQFINFYFKDEEGKLIWRAFSISSSPNRRYVEITVKMGGHVGDLLGKLPDGDIVEVRGPFGGMLDFLASKDVVLIAGGIGVSPFMSNIRYATEENLGIKIMLFYSCKTKGKVAFAKELSKLAKKNSNLRVICTLTEPGAKYWKGEIGRINAEMISKYIKAHKDKMYFLCGPPEMVANLIQVLKGLGVPEEKIKKEAWG